MSETILVAVLGLVGGGALVAIVLLLRPKPAAAPDPAAEHLAELRRLQVESGTLMRAMSDMVTRSQGELQRTVDQRLESLTQRVGLSLQDATKNTTDNLQKLNERLAVIDTAQKNITELASQVTTLQGVLTNKQSRGAFGQGRMEIIVQDGLPKGCYEFQYTLSNRARPDCAVFLPDGRPLVVDAKFPLEAVTAFREATTDDERRQAATRLRQDIGRHIGDISQKYLIPGETQDLALMFVPSESVYAELHDGFDDIVQKAYRARVVIVSPSLLMLAVQVVQQIQKDAKMRAAADRIHAEVGHLMNDLRRLHERVMKLQQHFGQANEDVRQIVISAEKIEKRGTRIQEVEFDSPDEQTPSTLMPPKPLAAAE